jgi:hypothetical protein
MQKLLFGGRDWSLQLTASFLKSIGLRGTISRQNASSP